MSELEEYFKENNNIILVDGSYFVFYRFYALLSWWKLRHADTYEAVKVSPIDNPEFVSQFNKLCKASLLNIHKQFNKTDNKNKQTKNTLKEQKEPVLCIAKDCRRSDIWRMAHFPEYKGTRDKVETIPPFFKYFYETIIPETQHIILESPCLEADDCIAITINIISTYLVIHNISLQEKKFIIIASDNDYLQLLSKDKTKLYDLKFTNLGEKRCPDGDYDFALFCKIINGDKSDNISSVFSKQLNQTKMKQLYLNINEVGNKNNEQKEQYRESILGIHKSKYELNEMLVDFKHIPLELKTPFIQKYLPTLYSLR